MHALRLLYCSIAVVLLSSVFCLRVSAATATKPDGTVTPDSIQLTSGQVLQGLIVRQTNKSVTIQLPYGEKTVDTKDIVRIRNVGEDQTYFTRILAPGTLPPWRIIANDLRNQDEIKSFRQIPATVIDEGVFKNVPYESFRANDFFELNIYGDPDDPAGVELGVYGPMRYARNTHQLIRQFLASYLTTTDELRVLYAMDQKKDLKRVDNITIEITSPEGLDAYGAYWISFYNEKKLNQIRLSDAEYRKLTLPVDQVLDQKGKVKFFGIEFDPDHPSRFLQSLKNERSFTEGFYRDKDGTFHIYSPEAKHLNANAKSN